MRKHRLISLLIATIAASVGHGQQFDKWYFGRTAALSFTPNGPQPIPAVLGNSAMLADEGSASISDEDGNLLFYTNGVTVYNKTHQVMLNGDNIGGHLSSCQVLIIPQPGSSIYYVFTTGAIETNFTEGYRYSIVDMSRDNGKGEVIAKKISLWPSCTERMTAARHANGYDVWVITNDNSSNTFRSWLVTCNGLQPSAVVSTVGDMLNGAWVAINAGMMKVSADGKTLAQTHFPFIDEVTSPPNFCQLFDFDNSTGLLSNPRKIGFASGQFTHCEFSPDSKMLYLSRPHEKKIDQVEITLPSMAAILASRYTINTSVAFYDMQLAPDEKIYCSKPGIALSVINLPNQKGGACRFVEEQLSILPGSSFIGLPSHINDAFGTPDFNNGFTQTILDSCSGTVQFNGFSNMPAPVSWEWDFGDGQTSALQNPLHIFQNPSQTHNVRLKIKSASVCGVITRSKRFKPSGTVTGKAAFDFVVRCDSGYVRFINKTPDTTSLHGAFEWSFGDGNTSLLTNPVHSYTSPGIYSVKLKINTGLACLNDSVSLPVEVRDFSINTIPDQVIRVGQKVYLSTDQPATDFHWSPPQWLSDTAIRNPVAMPLQDITYKVFAARGDGCSDQDSVFIKVIQYNDVYVPTAFTPNGDGRNDNIYPYYPGHLTLKSFSIFSRWGQRLFTTSQRSVGWDGKLNGVVQQTGIYVWGVILTNQKGETIEEKGTLTLIR